MKVTNFVEHEDGSATVKFDTTPEETQFLVGYAILDILQKQMERAKDNEDNIYSPVSK